MARPPSGNIWIDTFDDLQTTELEERYRRTWVLQFNYRLTDTLTQEQKQNGWKISQANSIASFTCSACSKTWSSHRVSLLFHYCLGQTRRGIVLLRPYGQMCRECNNDYYMKPTFREKTAEGVLEKLILKIRKNCYQEYFDRTEQELKHRVVRPKPHERHLCEACADGLCNKDNDS
ncbi:receptor-transporting protein 3-like [Mixophyes fleayi]|uniref:receptor-transporting protein 3-like n=1 Tax=Mixophyes fleayi TaxID=3061075 RepID=UPI003F4DFE12